MGKNKIPETGIYDARQLGRGRMLLLGFQHMFAMFGATILVPILTGLDVSNTLLFAGLGTLLFHLLAKGKVPAFLGSSFAFLGGYSAIAPMLENPDAPGLFNVPNTEMLPYACFGVACAGLMYLVLSLLFKIFGVRRVMRFFPPIVTGPIIIAIGLSLSSSAVNNCATSWPVALVAILVVIVCNIWGKGMIKIIPILIGIVGAYIIALIVGWVDYSGLATAAAVGIPPFTIAKFSGSAILTMAPIALATMMEHVGDISAISATTGQNFVEDPGLHRTLLGDGLATSLAALFGAPANTTYGENTGVLALSKVYDPRVIRIAAVLAIIFSCCPKFAEVVHAMPTATIGGVSLVLYGMISAVGVRNVVENKVDFTKSRNVIIAALILVLAIGITYTAPIQIGIVSFSGLAVASIVGIVLNAILPGNDFEFDVSELEEAAE